jgi:hypothetical protein
MKESKDVNQALENVTALEGLLSALEAQFQREVQDVTAASDPLVEQFEVVCLKPTKSNIAVKLVGLAWTPHWQTDGGLLPAWE